MSDRSARTAAPRDVPPPRPVAAGPVPTAEGGLGRAARAVAEAVSGLLGAEPAAGPAADGTAGPTTRTGVRDVLGAVASAVGGAVGGNRDTGAGPAPTGAAGSGRSPGSALGDLLAAVAPRLPIRDAARLRAAHPGATDAEIADALVARAGRLTGGIGAATGGLAAVRRVGAPSLLLLPLELGAETVLTAAVEVVLVGELHELHGRPAAGDARARGAAYLSSWSAQRSVLGATGLTSALGAAGLRALQRRAGRRMSGSAPLLAGAALAGRFNRRATESLADRVLRDLRGGS